MRKLHLQTGGRPRSLDDLQVVTDHIEKTTQAPYKGRGAFIVQGCEVVGGNSINAGVVFIDGVLMEFAGASGVTFPVYMKADAEVFDVEQVYESGDTKTTQREIKASVSVSAPGAGEYITFTVNGGRTYFDAISDKVVLLSGSQTIAGVKTFAEKITAAGVNLNDELSAIKSGTYTFSGNKTFSGLVKASSAQFTGLTVPTSGAGVEALYGTFGIINAYDRDLGVYKELRINASKLILNNEPGSGNVGIGTASPNAPLQFANATANRKIVLYESLNSDHKFIGFGVNSPAALRYQVSATDEDHIFYAGTSSTTSTELMRILGNGNVYVPNGAFFCSNIDTYSGNMTIGSSAQSNATTIRAANAPIYFQTFGIERMRITSNGEVGIGGAPSFKLDITGSTSTKVRAHTTGATEAGFIVERTVNTPGKWEIYMATGSTDLRFFSTADRFTFSSAGVGTAANWTATSDRRKKTNIQKFSGAGILEKVRAISENIFSYNWKDSGKHEVGFVAQELREVAPEFVEVPENEEDAWSVNYSKMVVPLYSGMAALMDRIAQLENKLKAHGIA